MRNNLTSADELPGCTARLIVNGGASTGTGFFVIPGYLLTCAHVVATSDPPQTSIEAIWGGQSYPATLVHATSTEYPDLALLQIANPPDHPCVSLRATAAPNDLLYTYGYPDRYSQGDPATFSCEGLTGGQNVLIKFKLGEVRPGFSGSPLLNQRTEAVCGVVKLTRGADTSMGGRATPIDRAFAEFPDLLHMYNEFQNQNRPWARYLSGRNNLAGESGEMRPISPHEPIKVFFSYHENDADKKILHYLELQLSLLRRNKFISSWDTGKLLPNQSVEEETLKQLASAHIICLLVSPNYIADDTLYEVHIACAMERRKNEGTIVIPILARPTEGWQATPFGGLLPVPRNRRPMNQWPDMDEVSAEVAKEIRLVVERLRKPES